MISQQVVFSTNMWMTSIWQKSYQKTALVSDGVKDTSLKAKAEAKDSTLNAKTKDFEIVLEDPRGRGLVFEDSNTGSSKMSSIVHDVISWSYKNLMNINWSKTKEMAIVTEAGSPFDALSFSNNIVEQVHFFKLLGVTIDDDLKWSTHVNTICSKASSRLHSLKVLKRCSLSTSDLLNFYTSAVK